MVDVSGGASSASTGLCLECNGPEGGKLGKWVTCLKCHLNAHTSCCNLGGIKASPKEVNWVCDKCAYEIRILNSNGNGNSLHKEIME